MQNAAIILLQFGSGPIRGFAVTVGGRRTMRAMRRKAPGVLHQARKYSSFAPGVEGAVIFP